MAKTILYWFRNDLRLHDNPALHYACQQADYLLPIYWWDTTQQQHTTWGFVRQVGDRDDHWVTMQAWLIGADRYRLYCVGPQAEAVIEKINAALDTTPKWLKKRIALERHRSRGELKRKKKTKAVPKRANPKAPPQAKKRKVRAFLPASHEDLTPQFKKSRIFWNEAIDAAVAIFDIKRDAKSSAREIVARRLWHSLDKSDYQFAQIRQGEFTLRFTIVDGRWRGVGLTPVTVSCTKDNRDPHYRKMRKWLHRKLHGLSPPKAARRRDLLFDRDGLLAA